MQPERFITNLITHVPGTGQVSTPGASLELVTSADYCYPGPWTADSDGIYLLTTGTGQDNVSLVRFCIKIAASLSSTRRRGT